MGKKFQEIVESEINFMNNFLQNKFELNIHLKPKAYFIKKNDKFQNFNLHNNLKKDFEYVKKSRTGICNPDYNAILVGTIDRAILGEEVGHNIHFGYSRGLIEHRTSVGRFYFGVISEMLGFFSSKIIEPSRENEFHCLENKLQKINKLHENFELIHDLYKKEGGNFGTNEYEKLVYIEDYGMGEVLYDRYMKGRINEKNIKEIFEAELVEEMDLLYWYSKIKEDFLKQ